MKRSGIVEITPLLLRHLLGIDAKYSIRAVFKDDPRDTFKIVIDGDDMPEVGEGCQIPVIEAKVIERKMVFDLPASLDWPNK